MSAEFLTRRQKQILDFMSEFHSQNGVSPTHREICVRFGYSSYGTVHKHLKLLEQKGYLRRHWNQKRGVELTDQGKQSGKGAVQELPFYGAIAAGRPLEAVTGNETLAVPQHLLSGRTGEHYVLTVVGDSMIEEGIYDGDLVVVERREQALSGEMVVALVGHDATLKRFYPEGPLVRLQPSNAALEPLRIPSDEVAIQGVVVGLMRKF